MIYTSRRAWREVPSSAFLRPGAQAQIQPEDGSALQGSPLTSPDCGQEAERKLRHLGANAAPIQLCGHNKASATPLNDARPGRNPESGTGGLAKVSTACHPDAHQRLSSTWHAQNSSLKSNTAPTRLWERSCFNAVGLLMERLADCS